MLLGYFGILCAIISKSVTSSKSLTPAGGNSAVYMVPPLRRLNAPIILRRNSTSKTHYYLQPSSAVFSETINPSFREAFSSANIQRISVSSLSLFPPDSYLSQETVYSTIVEHSLNWEQNSTQQYKNNDSNVSSSYYLQNTIIPTAVKSSTSESSVDKSTMFLQNIHSTQQDVNDTIAYSIVNSALNSSWNISDIKQSLFHTPTHVSYTVIESNISSATMALSYNIKPLFSVPVNATPTQVPYSPVASVFKVLSLSAIQTIRTKQSLSDSPDMSLIIVPTPISEHGLPSIWPDFSVSSKSDIRSSNAFESLWNSSIVWSSVISPISDSHGHFLFPSSGTSLEHHSRSTGYPSMSFSDSELIPETFSAPPLYGQTISSQPRTDDFKASISSKTVSITLAASSDITFASTTSLPALTALTNYSTVLWNNGKTSVSQSVGATLSVPITASIASGFTSRTSSSVLVFLPNSISSSPMSTDRTIASSASISATLSSSIPAPTAFVSSSVSIPTALTCAQMKSYFPSYIEIDESEPVGSVLASMPLVTKSPNASFTVSVKEPQQLASIMNGYFGVRKTTLEYALILLKPVDVEQLYQLSGKTVPVKDILVHVDCSEKHYNSVLRESIAINMTICDEDDEMPRFLNQDDDKTCVVPVYKADASEDYTGELTVKPGKIVAVDGDLFVQHNISYSVMHAEPENYDDFFSLNTVDGSVNKTGLINASDPRKYLLFIQATEDSPQQKKKVAVLSIEVFAPSDPLDDLSTVDPTVKLSLKVISALVILGFVSGFIVVVHHRWRRKKSRVNTEKFEPCEIAREMKLPELAVYRSSVSSLECEPTDPNKDIPSISSPSQIQVIPAVTTFIGKKRKVIVKKPIDTRLRPGWNAPIPKKKPTQYSPYKSVKMQ